MLKKFRQDFSLFKANRRLRELILSEMPVGMVPDLRLDITKADDIGFLNDARLKRGKNCFELELFNSQKKQPQKLARTYIPAYFYWFSQCGPEVEEVLVDCSDGDAPSFARFANSTYSKDVVPLPDAHFFANRGYGKIDALATNTVETWFGRSDEIVWRGLPTGRGYFNITDHLKSHPGTVQRLRMAQITKGTEIDFRFVQSENVEWNTITMAGKLTADRIPQESWGGRKFAIDIDGYTNAWSNLMVRLKLGCCVLKVDSEFGYRQWYYDRLKPFEHFVPVKADLSDLFDKVDWVRSHENEASEIAQAGQALAREMTFESETKKAVRLISENWSR